MTKLLQKFTLEFLQEFCSVASDLYFLPWKREKSYSPQVETEFIIKGSEHDSRIVEAYIAVCLST